MNNRSIQHIFLWVGVTVPRQCNYQLQTMGPSPSHGRVGERDAGHASLKVYEPVAERYLSFSLPREKDDGQY